MSSLKLVDEGLLEGRYTKENGVKLEALGQIGLDLAQKQAKRWCFPARMAISSKVCACRKAVARCWRTIWPPGGMRWRAQLRRGEENRLE